MTTSFQREPSKSPATVISRLIRFVGLFWLAITSWCFPCLGTFLPVMHLHRVKARKLTFQYWQLSCRHVT
jgi:hypothetical protein